MEYFAGLDVSMEETHVCVVTRNGTVVFEAKVPSTPASIAAALARAGGGRRAISRRHGTAQLPSGATPVGGSR